MTMRSRKKEPTIIDAASQRVSMVKRGDPEQISRILESIMTDEKDRKWIKKKPSKTQAEWHSRAQDQDE